DGILMPENYLNIATANITIPKLNNTNAKVDSARIYSGGLDWATITAKTNDIPLGEFVKIQGPEAKIEGKESHYTTRIAGGAQLKFGKYFDASGQATLLFDRHDSTTTKLKVETAKVTAKGNLDLPGENGLIPGWPLKFEFSYPIVPGAFEATAGLSIYGGVKIGLTGEIGKDNPEDPWNFHVNPEAKGIIGTELYAGAAVGSSYILSLGAYLTAAAEAQAIGGLKFAGELDYDAEAKKITSNNVTSIYYANADFIAKVGAKVKATAFYVFEKDLYRITFADWKIGSGAIKGNIKLDENGNITFESPEKSGVMGGEIKRDPSGGPQYEVISKQQADKLLRDAAAKIEGAGGKERQKILGEVRQAYEKALRDTEQLIAKEDKAGQKNADRIQQLDDQMAEYGKMLNSLSRSGKTTYKQTIHRRFWFNTTKTYSKKQLNLLINEAEPLMSEAFASNRHFNMLLNNLEKQQQESQSVLANVQQAIADLKGLEQGDGVDNIENMETRKEQIETEGQEIKATQEILEKQISQTEKTIKKVASTK
ncbi:hypothetical protein, partial [Limnospira fusiformis]|uniref:hypothetical protein n=1 Tax=Limnospira fusiformis TaxID=54297 RepID=UPI002AA246E3|nr:hypothetical protein [Limnospira fusiformis LS22]